MKPILRSVLAAGLAVSGPAAAEEFDCVIEPFVVVEIGSAADGIVEEILVQRGAPIAKGEVIARLDSAVELASLRMAEAAAASEVAMEMARNDIALFEKEVERASQLAEKRLTAQNVLETAETELARARLELSRAQQQRELARLDVARARAQIERRVVRSPIDGVVLRRLVGPGEFVYSQAQVAQLASVDPLYVDAFLPVDLYRQISQGDYLVVEPAEPVGGVYLAEVTAVDQVFDAASDTFGVRLTLENPDGALPAGLDCTLLVE